MLLLRKQGRIHDQQMRLLEAARLNHMTETQTTFTRKTRVFHDFMNWCETNGRTYGRTDGHTHF